MISEEEMMVIMLAAEAGHFRHRTGLKALTEMMEGLLCRAVDPQNLRALVWGFDVTYQTRNGTRWKYIPYSAADRPAGCVDLDAQDAQDRVSGVVKWEAR